ncbi:MAG TPA: NAD(P)-binding domain-containing protein [Candidatus Udaeobacter sp.]|jgi:thioredoxin reductase/NAD-dependent dihydropyrimidine dehydrogenase PreA subunit|nr:NAD(P)-binding domain-containing protein [Candidatus Udaeobacter sp.]
MIAILRRYATWLHLRWPAGTVEKLPRVGQGGGTSVPGLYIAGDLTGIPLLKFALDSGARATRRIHADLARETRSGDAEGAMPRSTHGPSHAPENARDLVIIGAGVSGLAAAAEAARLGLGFEVVEASRPLSTLIDFPRAKPIYTYPLAMKPEGPLEVTADLKEPLIAELESQRARLGIAVRPGRAVRITGAVGRFEVVLADGSSLKARRVLIAIGRSGDFRRLGVPGEDLPCVFHRLHDPRDFAGMPVLVVGGGDSAAETAIALTQGGARVTLVHRGAELTRPKPANLEQLERLRRDPAAHVSVERPVSERITTAIGDFLPEAGHGTLEILRSTEVAEIRDHEAVLRVPDGLRTVANEVVFVMIGREAPLDFLRLAGVRIAGDRTPMSWAGLALFLVACAWLYDWKSGGFFSALWYAHHWFPVDLPERLATLGGRIAADARDPSTLIGTLAISAASPSFYYTLAYSLVVVIFGIRRIRRRRTPYVTAQTTTLMLIQVIPLFLLPEIALPLLDRHGLLPAGLADALFPRVNYGHGREFWRAYGLILAWPLDVYNIFTHRPLGAWLVIGFVQTCVLIPLAVFFFGKGAYCGWICSCGALAETLGDTHRQKMPHGPGWNRLNLAGQVVLAIAVVLLLARIAGWILPEGNPAARLFESALEPGYKWGIDVFLAGVLGYGLYFWFSGRVWCRFFCPLAALMHVYARFSRFAIVADKKKCISCNVCTSVCHQGIDVMNFANKGAPMTDPECVRCSACVHDCPTGVLRFGQVSGAGQIISVDSLAASPVLMREGE